MLIRNEAHDAATGTFTVRIIDTVARTLTVEVGGVVESTRPLDQTENDILDAQLADAADNADRDAKLATVGQAVATLRQWATDAAGATVTNGNNNAVTQTVVTRLGVFFDRFADLIEGQRIDQA